MRHTPRAASRRPTGSSRPSSAEVSNSKSGSLRRLVGRVDAGEAPASRPRAPSRRGPSGRGARTPRAACRRRPRGTARPAASCSSRASRRGRRRTARRARRRDTSPASASRRATWATRRTFSLRSAGVEAEVAAEAVAEVVAVEQVGGAARRRPACARARRRSSTCPTPAGRSARPSRRAGRATSQRSRRGSSGVVPDDVAAARPSTGWPSRAAAIMPAPTVSLVRSSMRMKAPVMRLRSYRSASTGALVRSAHAADVVELERPGGRLLASVVMSSRPCDGLDGRAHRARRVLEHVARARRAAARRPSSTPSRRARARPSARRRARRSGRRGRRRARRRAARSPTAAGPPASSGPSCVLDRRRPSCARRDGSTSTSSPAAQRAARELPGVAGARRRGRRAGGSPTAPGGAASSGCGRGAPRPSRAARAAAAPSYQGARVRALDHVVAVQRRDRDDARRRATSSRLAERAELGLDLAEARLVPVDEVHLVHARAPGAGCRAARTGRRGGATARRCRCARR